MSGIPPTPEATEALIRRIAFIRETHYGGFWDFTADLAHGDLAYSEQELRAHTDTTYFTDVSPSYSSSRPDTEVPRIPALRSPTIPPPLPRQLSFGRSESPRRWVSLRRAVPPLPPRALLTLLDPPHPLSRLGVRRRLLSLRRSHQTASSQSRVHTRPSGRTGAGAMEWRRSRCGRRTWMGRENGGVVRGGKGMGGDHQESRGGAVECHGDGYGRQ